MSLTIDNTEDKKINLSSEGNSGAESVINIDYNDTEYDIAVPFKCFCHNKTIKGKKYVK